MRVVIFGANGKVGKLVVAEALGRGHTVTAFVHKHSDFESNPNLHIARGDIHNSQDVAAAIQGADAVVSALGSWGTQSKDIVSSGMANIIPAMEKFGVKQIISLTGSDARAAGDELGLVHRVSYPFLKLVAGKILRDGEKHIELLAASQLNWTVLRSPAMNTRGEAEQYTLNMQRPLPWQTVHRNAVAQAMLDQLELKEWTARAPYISR